MICSNQMLNHYTHIWFRPEEMFLQSQLAIAFRKEKLNIFKTVPNMVIMLLYLMEVVLVFIKIEYLRNKCMNELSAPN